MSCSDRTSAKAKSSRCKKDCCTTRNRRGSPPGNVRKDMRPSLEFNQVPLHTKEGPTGRHDKPRKAGDPRSTDQRRGCEKILRHAHARGVLATEITPRHNSLRVKKQCHSGQTHKFNRQQVTRSHTQEVPESDTQVVAAGQTRGCNQAPPRITIPICFWQFLGTTYLLAAGTKTARRPCCSSSYNRFRRLHNGFLSSRQF